METFQIEAITELKREIDDLKHIKNGVDQQSKYRQQVFKSYQQQFQLANDKLEQYILEQYENQSQHDTVYINKLAINGELLALQHQLHPFNLQKQVLLRQAQDNDHQLVSLKQSSTKATLQKQRLSHEKAKMSYEIKQQQLKKAKLSTEIKYLRQNCEKYIREVSERMINNDNSQRSQQLSNIVNESYDVVSLLCLHSFNSKEQITRQYKIITERPILVSKVKQLGEVFKNQQLKNKEMMMRIHQQQKIHEQLLRQQEILNKELQILGNANIDNSRQIQSLTTSIRSEQLDSKNLQAKLIQYHTIRLDLQRTYNQLITQFKVCKQKDLMGVRSMTIKSKIDERNRQLKQYIFKERHKILQKYKKYIKPDDN